MSLVNGTSHESNCDYETAKKTADYLIKRLSHQPVLGIICGSGLGGLAEALQEKKTFDYKDIPEFPTSTVQGHSGKLVFGHLQDVQIVCMQGRFHYFEGHSLAKCVFPVRVMKLLGVHTIIVTNSSGAINQDYNVGDIMMIKDHINFVGMSGENPLRGLNDERWGPRFPPMSNAYDANLRAEVRNIAKSLGINDFFREGVYAVVGGPNYETVAETRALGILGADAVGMSTAHEVITAHHCGIKVFGLSLITNKCVNTYEAVNHANHEEVLVTANSRKEDLEKLVKALVKHIGSL